MTAEALFPNGQWRQLVGHGTLVLAGPAAAPWRVVRVAEVTTDGAAWLTLEPVPPHRVPLDRPVLSLPPCLAARHPVPA